MKIYSLYHNDTYVASFPKRETAVEYGKENYMDGWECNIVEEYLSKTPYNMYIGSPYTSLTNPNSIPCTVHPVISKPPATYPETYPKVWC